MLGKKSCMVWHDSSAPLLGTLLLTRHVTPCVALQYQAITSAQFSEEEEEGYPSSMEVPEDTIVLSKAIAKENVVCRFW